MCGICGIFHQGKLNITSEQICRMRDTMIERGPDTAGFKLLPESALGHRRLKIIDLSDSGNQPMTNEDKTLWLVFNGEIYNFQSLKKTLLQNGHDFKSGTDSEVIIHGYEQWGSNIFEKLTGMFAIALYDSHKKQLVLARDRMGKKPLFYSELNGVVYFSSDIKSIIEALPEQPSLDLAALDCYLHHIAVPDQHSIYQNVKKVYPGTYLIFNKEGKQVCTYWEWNYSVKTENPEKYILNKCEKLLTDAILKRTISDVPIGIMLSGGVDSSLIAAILSRNTSRTVKTFTVGFKNHPQDDVVAARKVAELYKTDHTELILDYDVSSNLLELVWQFGEPFADSSAIPTYLVSKAAKEHITVMLTGDGGDEAFGGYGRTIAALNTQILTRIYPPFLHNPTRWLLKNIGINPESDSLAGKMYYYLNYRAGFPYQSFYNTMGFHKYRNQLWNPKIFRQLSGHNPLHPFHDNFEKVAKLNSIDQVLFVDGRTRLMYDYLVKVDRSTMANSVEARSPFLDTELLEYCAKIPPRIKFKKRRTKYLLKKIGEKYLPKSLLYTEKRGFGVPVDSWIRNDLKNISEKLLFNRRAAARGYFDHHFIRQIWNEHQSGKVNHKHRLWALIWFELWHLMFIDKSISRDTSLSDLAQILE